MMNAIIEKMLIDNEGKDVVELYVQLDQQRDEEVKKMEKVPWEHFLRVIGYEERKSSQGSLFFEKDVKELSKWTRNLKKAFVNKHSDEVFINLRSQVLKQQKRTCAETMNDAAECKDVVVLDAKRLRRSVLSVEIAEVLVTNPWGGIQLDQTGELEEMAELHPFGCPDVLADDVVVPHAQSAKSASTSGVRRVEYNKWHALNWNRPIDPEKHKYCANQEGKCLGVRPCPHNDKQELINFDLGTNVGMLIEKEDGVKGRTVSKNGDNCLVQFPVRERGVWVWKTTAIARTVFGSLRARAMQKILGPQDDGDGIV